MRRKPPHFRHLMPHPDFSLDSEGELERALREGTAGSLLNRDKKKRRNYWSESNKVGNRPLKVGLVRGIFAFLYRLISIIVTAAVLI